ncbi:MAG: Trm112 family protein [Acidobacteriota bacterium]|nr:Trm112 family protein [Blastocatellia bacterium]MDW8411434.1 Trm112 family protein [Acidobacteriota bacterium]
MGKRISAGNNLERLIEKLACPVCKTKVELISSGLRCTKCRRVYPVIDGIPVMLVEEARSE